MAAKHSVNAYPDGLTRGQLAAALEEVQGEVDSLKEQVHARFAEALQQLALNRDNLLAELDQLIDTISNQLNERGNKLNALSAKRMLAQRQIHSDILNLHLQQELIQCDKEVCEILQQEIQFPRPALLWSRLPAEGICRIQKTDNRYRFVSDPEWSAASRGRGTDQLFFPVSVCSDSVSGCIFVSDSNLAASRVQVFSPEGEHVAEIAHWDIDYINAIVASEKSLFLATESKLIEMTKYGEERNSSELANNVKGMDFVEEKLYTCSKKSSVIRVFNKNLQPTELIQLNPLSFESQTTAYDVKVMKNNIYVLFGFIILVDNHFPHPVQEFDQSGVLVKSIVSGNCVVKAFNFVVSENCNIIVSDWGANRIKVFSGAGETLRIIGRDGLKGPGEVYLPRGVALDEKGRILVVDGKDQNKLQAF